MSITCTLHNITQHYITCTLHLHVHVHYIYMYITFTCTLHLHVHNIYMYITFTYTSTFTFMWHLHTQLYYSCSVDTDLFPSFSKPRVGFITSTFRAFVPTEQTGSILSLQFSCTLDICLKSCITVCTHYHLEGHWMFNYNIFVNVLYFG